MSSTTSSKSVRAAVWKLAPPTTIHPAESTIIPDDGAKYTPSIIGEDERVLVDFSDLQDGGKYRSIVKIQTRFENARKPVWMMGTGWLIRPDLIVTAAHNVYDWGHRYGATTQVKCYVGYNGRNSVKTPQVQARSGVNVVTTAEWIESLNSRLHDVAFIQVDRPFTGNLRTFNYVDTPLVGDKTLLGIVGYPGDKSLKDLETGDDEQGAQMYEEFAKSNYNIEASSRHMVEYELSTFGGQSGAPVLRKSNGQLISIGTHCYGGGGTECNAGNSIGNAYGNNYNALIRVFGLPNTFGEYGKIHVVDTQASALAPPPDGVNVYKSFKQRGPVSTSQAIGYDEEGFMDVFKSIANIGSKLTPIASPLLGPIGGILAPAVGGLLGSLTEYAISANSDLRENGAAERALLAEAALRAVLASEHTEALTGVISRMERIWHISAPKIDSLAPAVAPIVTACSKELSAPRRRTNRAFGDQDYTQDLPRRALAIDLPESAVSGEEASFVQGLIGPTQQIAGEEGLFDWLGTVLQKAVSAAKPIVSRPALAALSGLGGRVNSTLGVESSPPSTSIAHEEATKVLIKRAMMADAALQALMSLPSHELGQIKPANSETGDPEVIFDFIKNTVQKLGPPALDTSHNAAKTYLPALTNSTSLDSSNKSGFQTQASNVAHQGPRKPSLLQRLSETDASTKEDFRFDYGFLSR